MINLQSDILRKITFILVVFSLTGLCFFRAVLGLSFAQDNTRKDKPKQPVIKVVKIDITQTKRDKNKLEKLAKSLIRIERGDVFSPSRIQQSIDFLKQSNQFQNIHIESEEKDNELILIYRLKPFGLIKKIEVNGAYPLFERKVISALTFFTGDSFRKEELKNQEKAITELYKQNGFLDPAVSIEAVEDPGDGNFILRIHIETGPYETLEKIEINGNKAFSDAWLKLKMQVYRDSLFPGEMGRFIQKKVDEDVKSLTRYYREKSYADCRIEKKIERINNSRQIRIELNITEGPKYEVEFTGNEEFYTYTLKDELALFVESNENDLALRKSVRNIKQLYRNSGYLDVKV